MDKGIVMPHSELKQKETGDDVAVCLYTGRDCGGQTLAPAGIELFPFL